MENLNRQFSGLRDLNLEECAAINSIRQVGEGVGRLIETLRENGKVAPDPRWLATATTDLQKGFMALVRSVAKPTGFV